MSGAAPAPAVPPGRSTERTSLTWWRTAQTAIVCALILIRFERHQPLLAWIGGMLASVLAVACWLMARRRAADEPVPPAHLALLGTGALVVALAATVLAAVLLAV